MDADVGEFVPFGEAGGFADVAEEQVGLSHLLCRKVESAGDGFFDEAFLEADAEVAGDDFDEILGFERGAEFQSAQEQWELGK